MPDALPAATLPINQGQAPNMLDCIPGGLVVGFCHCAKVGYD